jgi:long-chain acyl-CoA synthetase
MQKTVLIIRENLFYLHATQYFIAMELKSLHHFYLNSANTLNSPQRVFMKYKAGNAYQDISYRETSEKIDAICGYLYQLGLQKGDRVAFIIENSPEYIFLDQACMKLGLVNASIYPTLTEGEVEYILKDSGSKVIIVGTSFLMKRILKIDANGTDLLKIITAFDDPPENPKVTSLSEVLRSGKSLYETSASQINNMLDSVGPNDLASLIYTSGTTGVPKGVMLSHNNFMSNCVAAKAVVSIINKDDIFLSFLPLCHVYERLATYYLSTYIGSTIAFAQGIETIAKNIMEVRPTVMASVPRLLEKIHDKVHKTATSQGGLKTKIFFWAFAQGNEKRLLNEDNLKPGLWLSFKLAIADTLVFKKIKAKMGGRMRLVVSGGAAMQPHVGIFFKNLDVTVMEGYGLTETSPFCSINEFERQVYGTVGRIAIEQQCAIQDPETKNIITIQTYASYDPKFECREGEILIKGPNVMQGYWNKPEATREVIDAEGWFHTGDIGMFYKGYLKITDRIKNMLVSSLGKNIYPSPVEACYSRSPKVEQIFLIGDKREYITAIIVVNKEELMEKFGKTPDFFEEPDMFIDDPAIHAWVEEDINKLGNSLAKFERIKNFILKRRPFTIEDGEYTLTLKVKRKVVEQKYKDEIEAMYSQSFVA